MRNVVVFPQPEGPRSVANEPRGTSNEMSSTAAASPNRFVTWVRRRWALSATAESCHSQPAAETLDDDEHHHRHADVADRERRRPAPVEVVDQLEDGDGRGRRSWREQEDDDRERRDGANERRDEPDLDRSAEHRDEHVT